MSKFEAFNLLTNIVRKGNGRARKFNLSFVWLSFLFWTSSYERALNDIKNFLRKGSSGELYCWGGIVYYFLKDYLRASTFFEKAEALDDKSFEIKYFLAETYYARSEIEKAEAKYRWLIGSSRFKSIGLYGAGCCLYKNHRYDEAVVFFNRALNHADEESRVKILNKKGLSLMAQGKLKEAEMCFNECLKYSPNDDFIRMNLALILSKTGDYKRAEEFYRKILSRFPYDITAINNLALCLAARGKYEEALEYCNRGLRIDPINGDLLVNKGYCLYKLRDYKNAMECLNEAERTVKDDIILLNNKALCFMALENYDEALKIFDRVLQRNQSDYVLINKAYCLIKKELYGEALECLGKVEDKNSKRPDIYTLQGICFEKLGDSEKAVEYFNKSLIA
jgi:tetratricopeptide (TPR) repeat protein